MLGVEIADLLEALLFKLTQICGARHLDDISRGACCSGWFLLFSGFVFDSSKLLQDFFDVASNILALAFKQLLQLAGGDLFFFDVNFGIFRLLSPNTALRCILLFALEQVLRELLDLFLEVHN